MAYAGKPLANFFTLGPLANVELLRANLDALRIYRADGEPLDLAELDAALAAAGQHLERVRASLSDYLIAPRFVIGQRVHLVEDEGMKVLKRGLRVHDITEGKSGRNDVVEVIDVDGRHETYLATQLIEAD